MCGRKPGDFSSIPQSPHQQQSAVCKTRPKSDVASVVLSNVSRINSKWFSSTTCWEFFRRFLGAVTLKLIEIFVLNTTILE